MPFKPNDSRINRKGRPKESKFDTKELKGLFRDLIEENAEFLLTNIDELTLRDRINLLKIVTPYVLARLNSKTNDDIILEQPLF
jgi:hypothetical protein